MSLVVVVLLYRFNGFSRGVFVIHWPQPTLPSRDCRPSVMTIGLLASAALSTNVKTGNFNDDFSSNQHRKEEQGKAKR